MAIGTAIFVRLKNLVCPESTSTKGPSSSSLVVVSVARLMFILTRLGDYSCAAIFSTSVRPSGGRFWNFSDPGNFSRFRARTRPPGGKSSRR